MTGVRREAAGLGLLLLAVGCTSGSHVAAPSPTPTSRFTSSATLTPATAAPATTTSTTAASGKDFGYLVGIASRSPLVLRFDRAQNLTGDAADEAAAAHGDETPVPNDYYVVNDSKLLRQLRVSSSVVVRGSVRLNAFAEPGGSDPVTLKERPLSVLLDYLGTAEGRQTAWNLVYGPGGTVVRIDEQYFP